MKKKTKTIILIILAAISVGAAIFAAKNFNVVHSTSEIQSESVSEGSSVSLNDVTDELGMAASAGSSVSNQITQSVIDPSLILSLTIPNIVLGSYIGFLAIDREKSK